MTAVISVMLATMLLFTFEGHETANTQRFSNSLVSLVPSGLVHWGIFVGSSILVFWEEQGMDS